MKKPLSGMLLALIIGLPGTGYCEIYKCLLETGVVEFTDEPCVGIPSERINIEEHYTSGSQGLRPYELERLQQLDQNLRFEKLLRMNEQQQLTALTVNDEVLCRSALLHLDNLNYRISSGYASLSSRFLSELLQVQRMKKNRYCR